MLRTTGGSAGWLTLAKMAAVAEGVTGAQCWTLPTTNKTLSPLPFLLLLARASSVFLYTSHGPLSRSLHLCRRLCLLLRLCLVKRRRRQPQGQSLPCASRSKSYLFPRSLASSWPSQAASSSAPASSSRRRASCAHRRVTLPERALPISSRCAPSHHRSLRSSLTSPILAAMVDGHDQCVFARLLAVATDLS